MARARNIKPSFFTNEVLGTLDPFVAITFVGLWCLADRTGRMEDRPLRIKAELFPYREGLDVNGYLTVLERNGFIDRYEVNGQKYIQVLKFEKHQSPHHTEKAKDYPENPSVNGDNGEVTVKQQNEQCEITVPKRSDSLIPDSLIPDSKKNTAQDEPAIPTRKKKIEKTGLPEDFGISERVRDWAAEKRFDRLDEHLDAFRRKATAKAYTYASWDDAFMEAIREDWAKLRAVQRSIYSAPDPAATVPSRQGVDPALAKAIKDSLSGAKPSAEIRERMAKLTGTRA